MACYATSYTVEGMYPFPVDMLRYAYSFPASTEDVMKAFMSADGRTSEELRRPMTVRVIQRHPRKETDLFDKRWASFGWRVTHRMLPNKID